MKWTEYPTQTDRNLRQNGTTLTGIVWSNAPAGRWVVPDGDKDHFTLVHGRTEPWSIPDENQLRRAAARAGGSENP
jgi:hypothetical protein